MLSHVVSRMRHHFRSTPPGEQPVPPDLRRFSEFESKFPAVSPGGYTRYYEIHGIPEPTLASTPISSPSPLPRSTSTSISAPRLGSPSTSSSSSHTPVSSKTTLTVIHEGSTSTVVIVGLKRVRVPSLSPTASLRRQKRRLLRTPSVERDFPVGKHVFLSSVRSKGSGGMSSDESATSHTTHSSSAAPPVVVNDADEDEASHLAKKVNVTPGLCERPDSRSSYCTANSHFSDDDV